jgi:hypothetical protein
MTDSEREAIVTRVLTNLGTTDFGSIAPSQMRQAAMAIRGEFLQARASQQELGEYVIRVVDTLLRNPKMTADQLEAAVQQLSEGFGFDLVVTQKDAYIASHELTLRIDRETVLVDRLRRGE